MTGYRLLAMKSSTRIAMPRGQYILSLALQKTQKPQSAAATDSLSLPAKKAKLCSVLQSLTSTSDLPPDICHRKLAGFSRNQIC